MKKDKKKLKGDEGRQEEANRAIIEGDARQEETKRR